ncbi:DUF1183 domain protein [Metarhizium robertsii]|uniref:Store-operated calcium entry-associated regulatory factor n=2 Tax=Metarhizium robertsii TaxID=568076 RepID=E9F0R6_METRA|nr:uncharacterized protein MAA_05865 [Metarhizium robertsii ARSEF 23]EFY98726.1 hypothetical protein MAA_05865 [Metarhizium robertsii ARSEF 23]EXV04117.1 DUF1183 domain protein [Metarhizium robertsii]
MHIHHLITFLALPILAAAARPKNAILLSQVQSLTLRGNGAKTTNRRVSAIPQLKCTSSRELCSLYSIDTMRCTNQGSSYGGEDIEWSCTATLPEELKLGSTDVICEGYASADDPYVLKGSCGVEYSLLLTSKGQERYPHIANPYGGYFSDGRGGTDLSAWLFTVVFVAVLGWIVYSACVAGNGGRQARGNTGRRWGGGGGGGGGGGFGGGGWGPGNDPPPPYPGTKPSSSGSAWGPGFWSGLAGGAAAGYLAGNRNRNDERRGYDRGWGSNTWGSGPASPRASPAASWGSSSSSGSSSRHESTGFGSTRRR